MYYDTVAHTGTWRAWTTSNATTDSTTATADTVWIRWADEGTTASASTNLVWVNWTTTDNTVGMTNHVPIVRFQPPEETEEQVAERKKKEKQRVLAEKRALKLFVGIVGRRAYRLFKKRGYHEVIGHSGKRYRLRAGRMIEEMAANFGDKIAAHLCINHGYDHHLPPMDVLVTQMLLVMSGEEGEKVLHRTANRNVVAA